MQMAADLGHSLAAATNSIGSQLLTLAGQNSAGVVDDQNAPQVRSSHSGLPDLLESQGPNLLQSLQRLAAVTALHS